MTSTDVGVPLGAVNRTDKTAVGTGVIACVPCGAFPAIANNRHAAQLEQLEQRAGDTRPSSLRPIRERNSNRLFTLCR
ncbi:hypothetical protein HaLaN_04438 [Haematococcus lacustris]|uniref:Uncharacterized protein n=1 Tax=Haematococcus lacustris TaxID=44745 RepID=A0A699YQZ4_HAELA|nr:hypothetical protein HaLaN_04438 [Haematococcus lacustris]